MNSVSVLTVSLNNNLAKYVIKSFEKFKPKDLNINYIVVENTNSTQFKDEICSAHDNITWVSNPNSLEPSWSHASGLQVGLDYVKDDWVFICDSDTVVVSETFFKEFFNKTDEGFNCIGVASHPGFNTVHLTGSLVKTELAKKIDLNPYRGDDGKFYDTGSKLTFEIENHFIFRNTWNDYSLVDIINEPYKSWGKDCGIDRCLDSDNNIMFLHLGRGTGKFLKTYNKFGKKTCNDWIEFIEGQLL